MSIHKTIGLTTFLSEIIVYKKSRKKIIFMSFIINFIRLVIDTMLELFSFGRKGISNKLPIFVKTNTGKQISLNLDPDWNISNVKKLVAPSLGISPNEVRQMTY